MSALINLDALEATARAAGGEQWTTDAELCAASGTFEGHHVWRLDGDAVARCYDNIGNMPEPIDSAEVAAHIAAANPATVLALIERLRAAETNDDAARARIVRLEALAQQQDTMLGKRPCQNKRCNELNAAHALLVEVLEECGASLDLEARISAFIMKGAA